MIMATYMDSAMAVYRITYIYLRFWNRGGNVIIRNGYRMVLFTDMPSGTADELVCAAPLGAFDGESIPLSFSVDALQNAG